MIVTSEVSPAGVITVVNHCWKAVFRLLNHGLMCRGYITKGKIIHSEKPDFQGTGYLEVVEKERNVIAFMRESDKKGTPFVEISPKVNEYIQELSDPCIQKVFSRLTKSDGFVTAIFPFKHYLNSFGGGSLQEEIEGVKKIEIWLERIKKLVNENIEDCDQDTIKRTEHYIEAIEEEIKSCKLLESDFKSLGTPFPR